jgi:hypothetical protein
MKLIIKALVLTFLCSNIQALTITCENGQKLLVKVDPFMHTASLSFEDIKIYIKEAQGVYDSSDVWIKSGSQGGPRVLHIGASRIENFRLTSFANFSLELEEDAQGLFKANSLSMSSGNAEMPESFKEKTIKFENMSCVINS